MPVGVRVNGQRWGVSPVRALAGLSVPVALAVSSALLMWAASAPITAVRARGPAPVDALLALGAAVVCAGLLALIALGAALSLVTALNGQVTGRIRRLALLLTPRVVQAAVGLAVGVTIVGGPVSSPAIGLAASPDVRPFTSSGAPPATGSHLPPGWSPDRPAATSASVLHPSVRHVATSQSRGHGAGRSGTANRVAPVVVARGDTLWAIAARHLGPGASVAQVAAEWPRWHAANRATIGPDPDLIVPGQRLRAPQNREPQNRQPTDRQESP